MSLTGKWVNSYNSLMTLVQAPDGTVTGEYSSTTGSTGKYYVLGHAGIADPTPALGQPAVLSIYWRSFTGGTGDPSWHWVSGLAGQMLLVNGQPQLSLIHAMVATDAFPGLADPGTYMDKLIYVPYTGGIPETHDRPRAPKVAADSLYGLWVCDQNGALMDLQPDPTYAGALTGKLVLVGHMSNPLIGFTDVYAQSGGLNLQAVSTCALDQSSGKCISLAGSLDLNGGLLTLTNLTAAATAPDSSYVQTTVDEWVFRKNA